MISVNQSRRGFLGLLGGLAASAVLDPERLLWVPGAKLISVPNLFVPEGPDFYAAGFVETVDQIIMQAYSIGDPNRRGIFPKPMTAVQMQMQSEQAYARAASDLMRFLDREVMEIS